MKNYQIPQDIRTPLKPIQVHSCPSSPCRTMSTPTYGLSNRINGVSKYNLPNLSLNPSYDVSSLNKQSKDSCANNLKSYHFCDTNTFSSKTSSAIKIPSPDRCRSRKPEPSYSVNNVHSLMSSPKWSRIKDKFENGELSRKENTTSSFIHVSNCNAKNYKKTTGTLVQKDSNVSKCSNYSYKPTVRNSSTESKSSTGHQASVGIDRTGIVKNTPISARSVAASLLPVSTRSTAVSLRKDSANSLKTDVASNIDAALNCSSLNNDFTSKTLGIKRVTTSSKSSRCSSPSATLRQPVRSRLTSRSRSPSITLSETSTSSLDKTVSKVASKSTDHTNTSSRVSKTEVKGASTYKSKKRWVKDDAGNWTRQDVSEESNTYLRQSRVRDSLGYGSSRTKCGSSSSETNFALARSPQGTLCKSKTTSHVPNNVGSVSQFAHKLSKSNTTSAVTYSSQVSKGSKSPDYKDSSKDKQPLNSSRIKSSNSSSSSTSSIGSAGDASIDRARRISVVQRAVLSYEGNLSILSPETQRKLKLLGEKVKAQEEDDNLYLAKFKNNCNATSEPSKVSKDVCCLDSSIIDSTTNQKSTCPTELGKPVQPIRNFLSRYQNMYKTKRENTESRNTLQNCENGGKSNALPKDSSGKLSTEAMRTSDALKSNVEKVNDLTKTIVHLENQSSEVAFQNNLSQSTCPSVNVRALTQKFGLSNTELNNSAVVRAEAKKNDGNTNKEKLLKPNSSFLWRFSDDEKPAKDSLVNFTDKNGEDHKYYTLENYSTLKSSKDSETSSNPSPRLTAGEACYQNIPEMTSEEKDDDGWMDMSDDEDTSSKAPSSKSSTLRRRTRRYSNYKGQLHKTWSQSFRDMVEPESSKRNSKSSLNNVDITKEGQLPYDQSYEHIYEPVYESLGNYLISNNGDNDSPSPDDDQNKELHSSFTSLESLQSDKQSSDHNGSPIKTTEDNTTNGKKKKHRSKIGQLKRHLSWTKSDIKLELSSKFNKIKIKKDVNNQTEIGVRMQDNGSSLTSPKKNTFIKCILKQKSADSLPAVKKTPSPTKKEGATFYVHLSMMREKQRPYSDSCVKGVETGTKIQAHQERRKTSEPALLVSQTKPITGRLRKGNSGQVIQRPKTPPPLPPTKVVPKPMNNDGPYLENVSALHKIGNKRNSLQNDFKSKGDDCKNSGDVEDSKIKFQKKGDTFPISLKDQIHLADVDEDMLNPIYASIDPSDFQGKRSSFASSASYDSSALTYESNSSGTSTSTTYSSGFSIHISETDMHFGRKSTPSCSSDLSLPLSKVYNDELLRSPFEEEPLYQFYHKDFQQRSALWYSVDGAESEFDEYFSIKTSDNGTKSPQKPTLHTQMSAMDLIQGEGGQRTLWSEVPEVQNSGILETISAVDRKIQEAMFEVITSEASYLKSLNFLLEHFVQCPEFSGDYSEKHVLDKRERHILFSDIPPVRDVSASLLADLEKRWLENIVLSDVCDIIYHHACKYFSVYVKYCSNQIYQDRTAKQLKESRPQFVEVLKKLESHPLCQGLDMHSFLILPMQRITRLPLLVDAIFHRLPIESPIYESCKMALALLNKLVAECNEGARKMERMEEMLVISHQLDFRDCKGLGLLSASRWLVKKGEIMQLVSDSTSKRTFGRNTKWCKVRLFLFLFTDLFIITKKKSDGSYCVVDYCPRNMVQVVPVDENATNIPSRFPSSCRNIFQLIILSNSEGKTVEMYLSCPLESDHTRWLNAFTPTKSENPDEKIYEKWDCPQVQCIETYIAQQPDELSIEEADVVNVLRKLADGWFEGERIRDGMRGWFPSSRTKEIISSHVRARNLRQRYRLLMLSQAYLEQHKAALSKGKQ